MAKILDGRVVRDHLASSLQQKIEDHKLSPTLAIIQVGNNLSSTKYIEQKKKFGERIGVRVKHLKYEENVSEKDVVESIMTLNNNKDVNGIIVQLPLPEHLSKENIIDAIIPEKDVDGLTTTNQAKLSQDDETGLVPATALGVMTLLDYYKIEVMGKKITVVGRSRLVGGPVATLLRRRGATVTVGHRQTLNMEEICREADIVVVAAGVPRLVNINYVSPGQVIVDVGITVDDDRLVGDVDFGVVAPIVEAITPVPGGVGPLTVASLFANVVRAAMI